MTGQIELSLFARPAIRSKLFISPNLIRLVTCADVAAAVVDVAVVDVAVVDVVDAALVVVCVVVDRDAVVVIVA